jgi:hypothetical protein
MNVSKLARCASIALVFLISLVSSAAESRGGTGTAAITGNVHTVDLARKSVIIKTSVGTSVKLSVGKATSITRNGAAVTLKDLALNDSVTAHYKVSRLSVTTLAASGPAVTTTSGQASTVSAAAGTIALGSTTLQTNANTRISRNGTIVGLRQITLKDALVAHVATGTNVTLDILSDGPDEGEVQGMISAISGNDVTITPGGAAPPVTVVVGASTLIEIEDASGTLADLAVGQSVEAEYDPATLAAFSIDVNNEDGQGEVQGTVAAVDAAAGTVTIAPQGGGANVTLTVNASTELDVNDEGGALADLQVGMPIKAEYDTVTLLASEIEAGGSDDSNDSEGSDD